MTDRDVPEFPKGRDRVSSLPADHTSGLLLDAGGLGEHREFTHDRRNEPQDHRSARVTLLHRFVVGSVRTAR